MSPEEFKAVSDGLDTALGLEVKKLNSTMQIKSLQANLKSKIDLANQTVAKASAKLDDAIGRQNDAVAKVESLAEEINKAAADIEATVGTNTNGAPE